MRKIVIAVVLFLCSSAANAEWTSLGVSPEGTVMYLDAATIRKQGQYRQVWTLTNYSLRRKDGHLSARSLQVYDCANSQYKFINFSSYSEQWVTGRNIEWHDPVPERWFAIPPGVNFGNAALRLMC